jgi:hypothetical protein
MWVRWIRIRIRNSAVQFELWRAVDAHNEGVKAQNGAVEGLWLVVADFIPF